MKKFLELIEQNPELKARVAALSKDPNAVVADIVALAKEYGLELTEADLEQTPAGELSDDELEAVAGGKSCTCFMGGGGTGDGKQNNGVDEDTCVCIAVGMGFYDDDVFDNRGRCSCPGFGTGDDM